MINFDQFINENLNEAFKFTEKQILDVANLIAAAISKLDNADAKVHDFEFDKGKGAGFEISIDGEKYEGGSYYVTDDGRVINAALPMTPEYARVGDTDVKKIMKNIKAYESTSNEAYDGNMSDFRHEFPMQFEETTGNSTKAIKKIAKKGKGFEVRTSTYMSKPEMEKVAAAMGMELKSYEKSTNVAISIFEAVEIERRARSIRESYTEDDINMSYGFFGTIVDIAKSEKEALKLFDEGVAQLQRAPYRLTEEEALAVLNSKMGRKAADQIVDGQADSAVLGLEQYYGKRLKSEIAKVQRATVSEAEEVFEWGGSDQYAMNQTIHKDMGKPKKMPSPFDKKLRAAAEDAVDWYWEDWPEYKTDRAGLIDNAVRSYLRAMFKKDWEMMVRMFEPVSEAKKSYTTKEIVKLAKAAGDWVVDAKYAIQDLAVSYGDKVPAKELNKVLSNYDLELEDLMEAVDLVHVYGKDGKMFGTGELVKTKGKKSLIRWDGSREEWVDSDLVKLVESRKVTLKRRYTENHPAITAGKHAKIRNKMLEAIGNDGKITQEEFDNILKELSSNGKRWSRNNAKYFNVSEEGISLSKFGKRILQSITVNEEQPEINKPLEMKVNEASLSQMRKDSKTKEYKEVSQAIDGASEASDIWNQLDPKMFKFTESEFEDIFDDWWNNQTRYDSILDFSRNAFAEDVHSLYLHLMKANESLTEKTTKNPEVWVPGEFDKALSKMPNSKITYEVVKNLAKKHKVFLDDAIAYVEYGWDLDLQENKDNTMKTSFIHESFSAFVENELNEAFKSSKLAGLFRNTRGKIDKNLAQAFYRMSNIKMDQVEDHDIIEIDPKTAYKDKRENAVYFYFTRNEKENPYATSEYANDRRIPANTLLAITNGKNKFYGVNWKRYGEKGYVMSLGSAGDSAGIGKSHSKYGGTGLSNVKRISDVADVAYVIDLNILRNRYDARALKDTRSAAKKGAIAFKTDKEFKQENLNRYNTIIANRAAQMPIDKMVADAIDTISSQIKDALVRGEKSRYGDIIVGRTDKGREAKMSDAANHMQRILDDFQRYVSYTNQAEEEKKAGYGGDYYAREVKNYAKSITDRIKQIDNFSYAW